MTTQIELNLVSSALQTKEWRSGQEWCHSGKKNECEKYQKTQISLITHRPLMLTNERILMEDFSIVDCSSPMTQDNGFEYTEDFDGRQNLDSSVLWYNLKFICDKGGAQTRSLREVYLFVKYQIQYIKQKKSTNKYFINILDGDTSFGAKKHFEYLLSKCDPQVSQFVFCGDLLEFSVWYPKTFPEAIEMTSKSLGQFYTTDAVSILRDLCPPADLPDTVSFIEPFVGTGELVEYAKTKFGITKFEMYDIDPKYDGAVVVKQDTLLIPPDFSNKYVITNPPYLARNKSSDKSIYNLYSENDLYKCFIRILSASVCAGGILIVPLNFWCSIRKSDRILRKQFLSIYNVIRVNVFEEQVFNDTSYTVCSFSFVKKRCEQTTVPFHIFPSDTPLIINIDLFSGTECMIGAEIYRAPTQSLYSVKRWVLTDNYDTPNTQIHLNALDGGVSGGKRICLYLSPEKGYRGYRGKSTDRTNATLIITPEISLDKQMWVVNRFNEYLEEQRQKYHSLFLCNYRESKDYARKRISFDLVYTIVQRLLQE